MAADPSNGLFLDWPKLRHRIPLRSECQQTAHHEFQGVHCAPARRASTSVKHPRGTAMCCGKSWPHAMTRGLAYVGSRIA